MCFDFYVGPRTRHRWHRLSELWLVNATLSCKVGKAPLPLSPPPPQRNDGPRDRTWPRPQEARGWPPTHWHTHRFLAVLWDWGAAKSQLQQNKEGTGEDKAGRRCEAGTPTYTSKISFAKALRANPENSVRAEGAPRPSHRGGRSDSRPSWKRHLWLRAAEHLEVGEARLCSRSWRQDEALRQGGLWLARVEGTLGQHRDMLDSHRLAPYPELTFQFFGEVWGRGMAGDEG